MQPQPVAVLLTAVGRLSLRLHGCFHPVLGDDLPPLPAAVVQPQITQLGHVARLQAQVAPAERDALGIGRPFRVADAERREQLAPRKLQGADAGRPRDRAGEQMHAARAVLKAASRLVAHRQVQHELGPVLAAAHLPERGLGGLGMAVQPGGHRHQMLERQPPLALVQMGHRPPVEDRRQGLRHAGEGRLADRDPGQRRRHGLGHRRQVVYLPVLEGPEIRVQHDAAVADDGEAVDARAVVAHMVEGLRQRVGIQPLGFRGRRTPALGRPDRLLRSGHRHARCAQHQGRCDQQRPAAPRPVPHRPGWSNAGGAPRSAHGLQPGDTGRRRAS
mmetsp:Transcript_6026/g.24040  ORF Transcript_6026/g.24040 Transcript_6026/m.24040 type:complete len:331 (+) Transcript_6026:2353-3345(+)